MLPVICQKYGCCILNFVVHTDMQIWNDGSDTSLPRIFMTLKKIARIYKNID